MPNAPILLEEMRTPIGLLRAFERCFARIDEVSGRARHVEVGLQRLASRSVSTDRLDQVTSALLIGSTETVLPAQRALIPFVTAAPTRTDATIGEAVSFGGATYIFNGSVWVKQSPTLPTNYWTTDSAQAIGPGAAKTLQDILTLAAGLAVTGGNVAITNSITALANLTMSGTLTKSAGNGAEVRLTTVTQEVTLSTAGTTTDSTIDLPGLALILPVLLRVTQTISGGGVTTFQTGDATTANRFRGAEPNLAAGNAFWCFSHWSGAVTTEATGPTQVSSAKVRFTTDATPTQGKIRVVIPAVEFTLPTS